MNTSREGVNPLRPYYRPPRIGEDAALSQGKPDPFALGSFASNGNASNARHIFPDIDYRDYVNNPSPSTIQSIKELVDELLWKYTSVLMSQPFEVAKTILQVRMQDDMQRLAGIQERASRPKSATPRDPTFEEDLTGNVMDAWRDPAVPVSAQYPDSDEDDEPSYFTSNAPFTPAPSTRSSRQAPSIPLESPKLPKKPELPPHHLELKRPDSILDVISQLWSKEGAWGVWKGSNATFFYTVLQSLLENWSRSLLSALLNVPDLGVKDDVDRLVDVAFPYPWASLCVAATAAIATGLILAPLDLVRTRLILTPVGRGSRRSVSLLRSLPSWLCHPSLIAPTILHSIINPILTLSTPLVLRSQFMIDREASPTTFSVAKFCTSCVSLFIKLPLETVLRRGQATLLLNPLYAQALDKTGKIDTIIQPGKYNGVVGTMYTIVMEEGSRAVPVQPKGATKGKKSKQAKVAEIVYRRGQGMEGLWRGWKVSWWGLLGLWTAGIAGGGGEGEF